MKREIKFRAWREGEMFFPKTYECQSLNEEILFIQQECVIMQFTGLLDKNGKEIYEGDIVKFIDDTTMPDTPTECITEVFWWDIMACFNLKNTHHNFNFTTVDGMEIVGNIHETSELLVVSD